MRPYLGTRASLIATVLLAVVMLVGGGLCLLEGDEHVGSCGQGHDLCASALPGPGVVLVATLTVLGRSVQLLGWSAVPAVLSALDPPPRALPFAR